MRNVRLLTAAATVALLVAAGCTGGGGSGASPSAPSPTPAPAPPAPLEPGTASEPSPPAEPSPDDLPVVDPTDHAPSLVRILSSGGASLGLGRDDSVLAREEPFEDELGEVHVRFERFHAGLPVVGGDFVAHSLETRGAGGFSATLRERLTVDLAATLSQDEAVNIAVPTFRGVLTAAPRTELLIDALEGPPAIAYDVVLEGQVADGTPSILHVLVDARSGEVRRGFDEVHTWGPPWAPWNRHRPPPYGPAPPPPPPPAPVTRTAAVGTGNSLFGGVVPLKTARVSTGVFELRDLSAENTDARTIDLLQMMGGGGIIVTDADGVWGNFQPGDRSSAAVDAHYGARNAYDYFLSAHGRRGVAHDGQGAEVRVHFGRNVSNAFWIDGCSCMTFGDGNGVFMKAFVPLDIVAHEMTHGVTARTARLVYAGESGGLNEATSDIFATCAEFFAANPSEPGNYIIGEKIFPPGGSLRSMSDPRSDGASVDHYSLYRAGMDVHYSSGIGNSFFHLLSEGGTNRTSGLAVTGITRAKAARIWYRALTVYMTSGTTYAGARTATLSAAQDLFGASSPERTAVGAAWTAVGVR